jgi:hypothetical protein
VHALILERGRGSGMFCFEEMQNGVIWCHFKVPGGNKANVEERQRFPQERPRILVRGINRRVR